MLLRAKQFNNLLITLHLGFSSVMAAVLLMPKIVQLSNNKIPFQLQTTNKQFVSVLPFGDIFSRKHSTFVFLTQFCLRSLLGLSELTL